MYTYNRLASVLIGVTKGGGITPPPPLCSYGPKNNIGRDMVKLSPAWNRQLRRIYCLIFCSVNRGEITECVHVEFDDKLFIWLYRTWKPPIVKSGIQYYSGVYTKVVTSVISMGGPDVWPNIFSILYPAGYIYQI